MTIVLDFRRHNLEIYFDQCFNPITNYLLENQFDGNNNMFNQKVKLFTKTFVANALSLLGHSELSIENFYVSNILDYRSKYISILPCDKYCERICARRKNIMNLN